MYCISESNDWDGEEHIVQIQKWMFNEYDASITNNWGDTLYSLYIKYLTDHKPMRLHNQILKLFPDRATIKEYNC